jgi:hypothetical protein
MVNVDNIKKDLNDIKSNMEKLNPEGLVREIIKLTVNSKNLIQAIQEIITETQDWQVQLFWGSVLTLILVKYLY